MNLPAGELDGPIIDRWVRPLFSEALAREEVYLANHSLGRPPDQTRSDVAEGLALWYRDMDEAWDGWMAEMSSWRAGVVDLLGLERPDAVVPRASCGQALRAVLNAYPPSRPVKVVATDLEFDSIDFVLKSYAEAGRAEVTLVPSGRRRGAPWLDAGAVADAAGPDTDLVVVSAVVFATGQVVRGLDELVSRAHAQGARVLVDAYHAVGVLPFALGEADFAMGGSYKYLRGGPGCCWLAVHPRHLGPDGPKTVDTGWFAKEDTFGYARPSGAPRKAGGDGWLESTPAVLPFYQARAGLAFTRAVGAARIRAYGFGLAGRLRDGFRECGLPVLDTGDPEDFGAFVCVAHADARHASEQLKAVGINTDARGHFVRFGPDLLTTDEEVDRAVAAVGQLWFT